MNKELNKKYKTEFDHWLNGGRLLSKHINDKDWYETTDPSFSNINVSYVIYDEYVELRKALAEGKTVQYRNTNIKGFENWEDLNGLSFNHNFEHRVKPDEPQFKVGDFVRNISSNTTFKYTSDMLKPDPSCCELWKPKPGEWCWFFNDDRIPTISQFVEINEDMTKRKYFAVLPNRPHAFGTWYRRCEPFIGTLPTNLQD